VTVLRAGRRGFGFWQGQGFLSLCHRTRTGSGTRPASCPIGAGGDGGSFLGGGTAFPYGAEISCVWSCASTPPGVFLEWCFAELGEHASSLVVVKSQGQLYLFYLYWKPHNNRLSLTLMSLRHDPQTGSGAQPAYQWVPGVLSTGIKRQRRETDHSPPPSV
jgi:hypothetical protein